MAFHDASAPDFATLDEKLRPIVARTWKGRELPFPILLDDTGKTLEAYGVRSFPTHVLIDPEGKLVADGETRLREILTQMREAAR